MRDFGIFSRPTKKNLSPASSKKLIAFLSQRNVAPLLKMGDDDDELTGNDAPATPPVEDAPPPSPDAVREDMVVNAVAFLKHPQVIPRFLFHICFLVLVFLVLVFLVFF